MKWLLTYLSIIWGSMLCAQQNSVGVIVGISVSRAGVAQQFGIQKAFKQHNVLIGAQQLINQSILSKTSSQGVFGNWKYMIGNDNIVSFIGVHASYLSKHNTSTEFPTRPKIVEISIIQGLQYQFGKHFVLGEWMGVGRYAERIENPNNSQIKIIDWPDFSGKLYLAYIF